MKKIKRNNIEYYKRSQKIKESRTELKKYKIYSIERRKINKEIFRGRESYENYIDKCAIKTFKRRIKFLKNPKGYKTKVISGVRFTRLSKRAQAIKISHKMYTYSQVVKKFF